MWPGGEASSSGEPLPERQSLSAHKAAKPRLPAKYAKEREKECFSFRALSRISRASFFRFTSARLNVLSRVKKNAGEEGPPASRKSIRNFRIEHIIFQKVSYGTYDAGVGVSPLSPNCWIRIPAVERWIYQ